MARRLVAIGVAVLIAAAGLASCAIRIGTIIDEDGNPIGHAIVLFAAITGEVFVVEVDEAGNFSVDDLPPSLYVTSVVADGFVPQTRTLAEDQVFSQWTLLADPAPGDDADSDGLSAAAEEAFGTDPVRADTDADGLDDRVEAVVTDPLGLPGLGADPLRRDIFLEIDRDASEPGTGSTVVTQPMIDWIISVYGGGPLLNPDGTTGITAHVDSGATGGGEDLWDVPAGFGCGGGGGYDPVGSHLAPERRGVFFHVLSGDLSSCGLFGVAYGSRRVVVDVGQPSAGALQDVIGAGTILHELGHNLGLRHGGDDNLACKPNYPSVMNYDPVPVVLRGLDYSRGEQPAVDENGIVETVPFYDWPTYDWNQDSIIQPAPYARDVDNFTIWPADIRALLDAAFPPTRCPLNGISPTPLTDHDDWSLIATNLPLVVAGPDDVQGEGSQAGEAVAVIGA